MCSLCPVETKIEWVTLGHDSLTQKTGTQLRLHRTAPQQSRRLLGMYLPAVLGRPICAGFYVRGMKRWGFCAPRKTCESIGDIWTYQWKKHRELVAFGARSAFVFRASIHLSRQSTLIKRA